MSGGEHSMLAGYHVWRYSRHIGIQFGPVTAALVALYPMAAAEAQVRGTSISRD
jgi:hypothetical protein